MSLENGIWYLETNSHGTDLAVRAINLTVMMVLSITTAIQLLSLARRSLSQFWLALSVTRRSTLEWA